MADVDLSDRTIVTTRAEPGQLEALLALTGATVVNVPLISIEPAEPGWDAGLDRLIDGSFGPVWLVAASQHGAAEAGRLARAHSRVRLAAVGTRTAEVLGDIAGWPVELVPPRQTAADLVEAFPPSVAGTSLAVIIQGDLAEPTLADGLRAKGYTVEARVAYRTLPRSVEPAVRDFVLRADAVAFASGSAVRAWARAIGTTTPPVVAAIGPTTAAAAEAAGIVVTHVAETHDLDGLVAVVTRALGPAS